MHDAKSDGATAREVSMAQANESIQDRDWSREEVNLVVADYFDMLRAELHTQAYNKTEHRHRLMSRLNTAMTTPEGGRMNSDTHPGK